MIRVFLDEIEPATRIFCCWKLFWTFWTLIFSLNLYYITRIRITTIMIGVARPRSSASATSMTGGYGRKRKNRDDGDDNRRRPDKNIQKDEPADLMEINNNFRQAEILIIGHSFVRRLRDYLVRVYGQFNNLNIQYNVANIDWFSVGGATVETFLYQQLQVIEQYHPDIVYIALGSNDLARWDADPVQVGTLIEDLVRQMRHLNVSQVIVGQTIFRGEHGIPHQILDYNERVVYLNAYLSFALQDDAIPGSFFWHHIGMWNNHLLVLGRDGTHLNRLGLHRYYRSVRGAILRAIARARLNGQLN